MKTLLTLAFCLLASTASAQILEVGLTAGHGTGQNSQTRSANFGGHAAYYLQHSFGLTGAHLEYNGEGSQDLPEGWESSTSMLQFMAVHKLPFASAREGAHLELMAGVANVSNATKAKYSTLTFESSGSKVHPVAGIGLGVISGLADLGLRFESILSDPSSYQMKARISVIIADWVTP